MIAPSSRTIAVIGDIHDQWDAADNASLMALGVDLALFVGDFGNENVPLVRCISELTLPFAAIMGNHDAWYTALPWGRKRAPYDHAMADRVQEQLDLLGAAHVGYGHRAFPALQLAVVGGRPFSWGGPTLSTDIFHRLRYGVNNLAESSERIQAAVAATEQNTLIFLGHNGPHGLGDQPESICGRDWEPRGGDFGDPDLAAAIAQARTLGKRIPLVTFGHMHHRLRHRQDRLRDRVVVDTHGTVYLNAAIAPRWQSFQGQKRRAFTLVEWRDQGVQKITQVWLNAEHQIVEAEALFKVENPASWVSKNPLF